MPSRTISLRLVWIVPFVLLTFTAVGLVGFLSWRNGQKAVNELVDQLIARTNELVTQHLESYLSVPKNLVQMDASTLESGALDGQDFSTVSHYFWQQAKLYGVTWINYGLKSGEYAGAGYFLDATGNKMGLGELSPATQMQYFNFFINDQGQRVEAEADPSYDHRNEAWYIDVMEANKPTWSAIYVWEGVYSNTMSVAVGQPIYHGNAQPIGAIGIDLSLTDISNFLRTLQVSPSARVFIIEQDGMVVATSSSEAPVVKTNQGVRRLNVVESTDPLIRATADFLTKQVGSFDQVQTSVAFQFSGEQQRQFLRVTPWRDELGLTWLVVVVVSESDFMAQINANTRQTIWLSLIALTAVSVLGLFTARLVTRPAAAFKLAAQRIASGQLDQQVPPSGIRELDAVGHSFNCMAAQLQDSFTKLAYAASHDALTGLPNRATLRQLLTESINRRNLCAQEASLASPYLFAILFLDLDYFKLLNDSLGHWAGDKVLIEVASRLRSCIGTRGHVARFGGDEFVILVEPITQPLDVMHIVEAILHEIQKPFLLNESTAFINTSIGVAFSSSYITDADGILRNADIALYRAKSKGKAVYEVFDDEMHVEVIERLQLETDLHTALQKNELAIYYQPIVNANTLEIVGVEALLRWKHPKFGMISPAKFIPIAEETGLIIPMGWWVLHQSCRQMMQWLQQFPYTSMLVSVNLSIRQFLHPDLLRQVDQILQDTGLPPQHLKLEITETLLIRDRITMQVRLSQLKTLGIKLSLDDFGTGYSSLSYLHHFPLDTLKIDRSFVQQMLTDKQCGAIVESITTMAHKLGMDVVAEGVEKQEELDYLRDAAHCEQIQGYLISTAVPAEEITQRLSQQIFSIPFYHKIAVG